MRRLIFLAVGVLFCLGPAVFAQDEGTDDLNRDVFAPFVSRLRVAVRDPQVRITWRDSEDLSDGSYLVYRHTDEINQNTLDAATLVATVEPGVETYLDTPLEEGNYYYAVIAAEADGRTYPIFVPFRNKTLRPVAVTRLESEEDLAASVYDIDARAQDMTVVLVFTPSRSGRTLAVYRSTAPFSELESIGDATLLQEIESSSRRFVDYPAPGVSYYYGVFDTVLIERGSLEVVEGANALASAVQINLPSQQGIAIQIPRATKRPAPLPILQLTSGLQSGRAPCDTGHSPFRDGRAPPPERGASRSPASREHAGTSRLRPRAGYPPGGASGDRRGRSADSRQDRQWRVCRG
jgi:hypothetical protein